MRIKDKTMLDRMNAETAEKVLSDLEAKHGSVQRAVRSAVASTKRILIALDSLGVHFRETLCVTHDGESGESRYDSMPIGSLKQPRKFRNALQKLISEHTEHS
jgi:hypothetical protein